uniref:Uncharacterized protein n=1 Tax=Romanomermis culicivorax TaxID=13658 RepID=A0A915KZG5_ROMCU
MLTEQSLFTITLNKDIPQEQQTFLMIRYVGCQIKTLKKKMWEARIQYHSINQNIRMPIEDVCHLEVACHQDRHIYMRNHSKSERVKNLEMQLAEIKGTISHKNRQDCTHCKSNMHSTQNCELLCTCAYCPWHGRTRSYQGDPPQHYDENQNMEVDNKLPIPPQESFKNSTPASSKQTEGQIAIDSLTNALSSLEIDAEVAKEDTTKSALLKQVATL